MDALFAFALQWTNPSHPPEHVAASDFQIAEMSLQLSLPADYKSAVLAAGLPHPTLALLDAIVEREADLHDLNHLYSPSEIVDYTPLSHAAGLPEYLLPIASDSLGSSFVYDMRDLSSGQGNTAPVYFWDNDFGTLDKVGTSFEDWISSYSEDWSKGLNYDDF
ncbi:MAG: SMI1/KNR4 family protein [Pseudomonadota bacterium]|nr:SMI1/KNR4 family protein [Pseudomonadota bacterium]